MRRIFLTLVCFLLLTVMAAAQKAGISQRGRATQELRESGFSIAHPSLPINTKILITNAATGKETEATVIKRISASGNRIADLSREVWQELRLGPYTEIIISTPPDLRSRPAAQVSFSEIPQIESVLSPATTTFTFPHDSLIIPEDERETQTLNDPHGTTINNSIYNLVYNFYFLLLDRKPGNGEWCKFGGNRVSPMYTPLSPVSSINYYLLRQMREAREAKLAKEMRETGEVELAGEAGETAYQVQPVASLPQSHPVPAFQEKDPEPLDIRTENQIQQTAANSQPALMRNIEVIPGLPDPGSNNIYRLQVGAFTVQASAARTAQLLRREGFNAVMEKYGSFYRVLAAQVPASMVHSTIQKLGSIGFNQVWLRKI